MKAVHDFIVGMGGESGEGIVLAGDILNMTAARMNVHTLSFRTFPAEARGGPSVVRLRFAQDHVHSLGDEYDILIAFDEGAYELHRPDLAEHGIVLINGEPEKPAQLHYPELADRIVYQVPMDRIARKEVGNPRSKNMIAIGAAAALFGFSTELIEQTITNRFSKRSTEMMNDNLQAFKAGFDYATSQIEKKDPYQLKAQKGDGFIVLSGNEAIALGALYAGCRFYAGYPITPASEIMEILAAELPRVGGAMVQAEDEIASIGMVLGGAFTGALSMTATSGPGLSLMAELIGLGSMAEIPCVIVDVQRGGPSTGLPTKTEQADLSLALAATHGDAPHVVLASTRVRDSFKIMFRAFEIAEQYQLPVIVLSEQAIGFRRAALSPALLHETEKKKVSPVLPELVENARYLRYQLTENGVSPRAVPGMHGYAHVATGLEHAEDGKPSYDPRTRRAMMQKRQRKLSRIARDFADADRYGDTKPEIGVIGWGSSAGPISEAVSRATEKGIKVGGLVPRLIFPSPNELIRPFLESCREVIVVEGNMTGQYASFLRSEFPGFTPVQLNKYDGTLIRTSEVLAKIEEVAR